MRFAEIVTSALFVVGVALLALLGLAAAILIPSLIVAVPVAMTVWLVVVVLQWTGVVA